MKIGIDLGGSHIAIGVVDNKGKIIEKFEKRLKGIEKKHIKETVIQYIIENVQVLREKHKITSVGIAIPGSVSKDTIIKSVNLGIKNFNIVEELKKEIDLPIQIRNDAKCAAIAESTYGSLKNYNRSIFLTLGTGIGGAVIINNNLLDCGEFAGCEFGHMIIEKNGKQCSCGKQGCFERYASMKALKTNLREVLEVGEEVSGKELFEVIRNNDILGTEEKFIKKDIFGTEEKFIKEYSESDLKSPDSKDTKAVKSEEIERVVQEFIENLSIGIANLINIFEPEAIGIGGSFVYFEEVLLDRLKTELLKENTLFNKRENITVKTAIFRNDAGIIGATI